MRTPLCGAQAGEPCDFAHLADFPDRSGKVGRVSVLCCRHCGTGITIPPLPDVSFLYDGRESQDFQPLASGFAHHIKRFAFGRQARALLRRLGFKSGRVLDFGCGSGLFTRRLGDALPGSAVIGSDFHDDPPSDLTDRAYTPMSALHGSTGQFDLVLAMHVLEHDDDAAGLLHRIAGQAKPGGRIVIEVPHIDCVWAKPFGVHWDAWYLPFHRSHFSRTGLRALVGAAGLTIENEVDICLPSMGRTLANMMGRRNSLPYLVAGILLHPIQWIGERVTRRPSAIRLIVRKP